MLSWIGVPWDLSMHVAVFERASGAEVGHAWAGGVSSASAAWGGVEVEAASRFRSALFSVVSGFRYAIHVVQVSEMGQISRAQARVSVVTSSGRSCSVPVRADGVNRRTGANRRHWFALSVETDQYGCVHVFENNQLAGYMGPLGVWTDSSGSRHRYSGRLG